MRLLFLLPLASSIQKAATTAFFNFLHSTFLGVLTTSIIQSYFIMDSSEQKTIPNGTAINSNRGHSITTIYTSRPSAARSTAISAACKYTHFYHETND
jgi:hypothetical protein